LSKFEEELNSVLGEKKVLKKEPMSNHTTFRIGGEAEYFLMPSCEEEIIRVQNILKKYSVPCFIMGNGSNLLVSDQGIEGAVLHLGENFSSILVDGATIQAQAGALLSKIAHVSAGHSLAGLEFIEGIPGSLGGAVTMNSGAYGGEMAQVITKVCVLTPQGERKILTNKEMDFGYRHSVVADQGLLVLSAEFGLKEGDKEEILALIKELSRRRKEKQPLEFPSAGSTFKRPQGYFAGKLIMDSGLAGYQHGGAKVSEKHCGFVINEGKATAEDVAAVIKHIKETVMEKFSVMLEPEIKFIGNFEEQ